MSSGGDDGALVSSATAAVADPVASSSNLSPEDIRKQVEAEQALADAQRRLKDVEGELESVRGQTATLNREKTAAESASSQLRSQLSSLQTAHHESSSQMAVLQTRVDAIEREKRELLEEIERVQTRSTRTTQELHALRSQRQETSQKVAHLDVEVSELKMTAETAKFNQERSTQALQAARNEILNLSKATSDVEERFGKYRAEKQAEVSNLQLEFDAMTGRLTSTDNSYQAIQRTYNDQSRRLAEAFANIATLTAAAASKKASTSSEITRLMDENRLLEKRSEEARTTIAEREAELERLLDASGDKEKAWEDRWKKEERLRREAEKRSEDLSVVVERLAMAGGDGNQLSPAAALASGMKQNGKSYTQFYTDYTLQEGKLRSAENEVARLTELLDEISADISEKKPLLDEQAVEHAHAVERANALATELASTMSARDAKEAEVRSLHAAASHHSDDVSGIQATADDLSRQVQGLLRQIAIMEDPNLAKVQINGTRTVTEDDIISEHLVEFQSIRSLQEQNQKLLRLTRTLMSKLDIKEGDRANADLEDIDTGATLDQATETIEKLHRQLLDAQKKINETTRERDFFSKLLAKGEGLRWPGQATSNGPLDNGVAPHEQALSSLQEEMEMIRVKADQEVSEAKTQLRVKSEEAGQADVGRARAEAQVTLLQEQHRMFNDSAALQKQELVNVESQLRQLQGSITQANNERRSALDQVASRQAEADRLRNEAANLRAEKEQWKTTETRLQSDFRTVQTERTRLQQLIDNLNNVHAETEKTRAEEKARLEKRVDDTEKELTALRGQVQQARNATQAAENRLADFDARVETATANVRAEKEAADALAQGRSTEIATLQAEIAKISNESENRKRIGLNYQRRTNELIAEKKTADESITAKDKEIAEINERTEAINKEIEQTKTQIAELEKKLADSERGSQLKDATVTRLQSEMAKAQSAVAPAAPQVDSAALATIKAERDSLQTRLTQAEKDLADAKAAAVSTTTAGDTGPDASRIQELSSQVEQLEKDKAAQDQRWEDGVSKVNRVNGQLRNRVSAFEAEKVTAEARIAELQTQLAAASSSSGANGDAGAAPDQATIDAAVRSAVSSREAELQTEHVRAMREARAGVKSEPTDPSRLDAQRAELESSFEKRVNDAAELRSQEVTTERNQLKGQVEELQQKIKTLERQVRTAEISRKTLERQRQDLETKLKKFEEGGATSIPSTSTAATPLTATAEAFTPSTTAATTEQPTASGSAQASSPTTVGPGSIRGNATRGRARGAARGGSVRGRPNSVLSTVNATLAQTSTATPTSPTGSNKRPLPEEGEIAEGSTAPSSDILARLNAPLESAPSTTGTGTGGRVLKRPRGAGPVRGGRGGARKPSVGSGGAQEGAVGGDGGGQSETQSGGNTEGAQGSGEDGSGGNEGSS